MERMRASVLVVAWAIAGCHETRHCSMPGDHETHAAEKVELPPVSLAGFTLGAEAADVAKQCGTPVGPVIQCGMTRIDFDAWGRAIAISTDDPAVSRAEAGAAIDKALGGDGTFVDQTQWSWQGGAVYFTVSPLSLRFDSDRMHERTIYGLPNCGVN